MSLDQCRQSNICANPEVDKLLLEHDKRPMEAFYEALHVTQGTELPMAIIMDQRCGIERRTEKGDGPWYLVGSTPLLLAISTGRVDVTKALLAAGADPNAEDLTGKNSLRGATRDCDLEAIESLISYGADINAVDRDGFTALHRAAVHPDASAVELLERSGTDLEAVDNEGRTPLHIAAPYCCVEIIKTLLKLGANQGAVDCAGRTPLHHAAASNYITADAIEAFQFNVAAFEVNLTAVDSDGRTPLQVYESRTSSDGSKDILALLTSGADIKALKKKWSFTFGLRKRLNVGSGCCLS